MLQASNTSLPTDLVVDSTENNLVAKFAGLNHAQVRYPLDYDVNDASGLWHRTRKL
jgi:hypothetical protein